MVAVNPKQYYLHFQKFSINKKHKNQKRGTPEMSFENFAARIADSNQIDNFEAPEIDFKE